MSQVKLPNLIIAGVVKGGTTSLYTYLARHPDICCSSVKETCYFLKYRYGQWDARYHNVSDPYQQYQSYFQHYQNQKYIMEATPAYFEGGKNVAQAIKNTLGDDVKIVIVLREPIQRLISFFKYKKTVLAIDKKLTLQAYINQCQSLPFEERIKEENDTYWGIDGGYYANYLPDWFQVFGDSVKVLFFDDLQTNVQSFLENLCAWLNLEYDFSEESFQVENKSLGYKNIYLQKIALSLNTKAEKFWRSHPMIKKNLRDIYRLLNGVKWEEKINSETLNYLKELYQPYNQELSKQLLAQNNSKLPQWLHNQ